CLGHKDGIVTGGDNDFTRDTGSRLSGARVVDNGEDIDCPVARADRGSNFLYRAFDSDIGWHR
ncbi:MAG: hypothetical protein AB9Q18_09015, partial [Candidatus Reddybacter sp.]